MTTAISGRVTRRLRWEALKLRRRLRTSALQVEYPATRILALRVRTVPAPPLSLICIYRARNAAIVAELIRAPELDRIALWGLDGVADQLRERTIGSGPGLRLELLNRLREHVAPDDATHLIVTDDDVRLTRGSFSLLARGAMAAGFDVYQPGHDDASNISFRDISLGKPLALARINWFVEAGPVVCFTPKAQQFVFPLPEELGMGWGVEALWARGSRDGLLQQGIIDGVTMRHLTPAGDDYDTEGHQAQAGAFANANGFFDWDELRRNRAIWRLTQRNPPWAS